MSKKALIFLVEGFEDIEAVTAIDILRRAGIEVTVAGLSSDPVKASNGTVVVPDMSLPKTTEGFDAIIIPGGGLGAENLASSKEISALIKEAFESRQLVAAICASPAVVLTPLGILKGRKATCYPSFQKQLDQEAVYEESLVVRDENIITSRGPATAILFALAIVEYLTGKETAEKIRSGTLLSEVLEG